MSGRELAGNGLPKTSGELTWEELVCPGVGCSRAVAGLNSLAEGTFGENYFPRGYGGVLLASCLVGVKTAKLDLFSGRRWSKIPALGYPNPRPGRPVSGWIQICCVTLDESLHLSRT